MRVILLAQSSASRHQRQLRPTRAARAPKPPAVTSPAPTRVIAVRPLRNLTGDATQDYFAAGLTDVLIAHLGSLGAIRVLPLPAAADGESTSAASMTMETLSAGGRL